MKAEIAQIQEQIKKKDQRNKLVIQRLKKQINTSQSKNNDLKLEHQRLRVIVEEENQYLDQFRAQPLESEDIQDAQDSESRQQSPDYDVDFYKEKDASFADEENQPSPSFGGEDEEFENAPVNPATGGLSQEEFDNVASDEFQMVFSEKYHSDHPDNLKVVQESEATGKVERWFANGKKEIVFKKGVRKEKWPDGYAIVYFKNGDIKQTMPDAKVVYYFADTKTTQTTMANGLNVYRFENQQIEKHYPDGTKEIK